MRANDARLSSRSSSLPASGLKIVTRGAASRSAHFGPRRVFMARANRLNMVAYSAKDTAVAATAMCTILTPQDSPLRVTNRVAMREISVTSPDNQGLCGLRTHRRSGAINALERHD